MLITIQYFAILFGPILGQTINMEKDHSNQFNLDTFLTTREESFKRLPKILTLLEITSPSVDLMMLTEFMMV